MLGPLLSGMKRVGASRPNQIAANTRLLKKVIRDEIRRMTR
jgi:hypothetical protein